LSYEQINALPSFYPIRERRVFSAGGLRATITPRVLDRAGIVTLQLIQDNLGKRPIYFSRTVGGYADELGFRPYLLGQGLVRKLMPDSIRATDNIVGIRGLGWVDLERTSTLLFDVYHPESAARERPLGWIDKPSQGILQLYGIVYAAFADYLRSGPALENEAMAMLADKAATLASRILAQTAR
jgi:hypothetical protein